MKLKTYTLILILTLVLVTPLTLRNNVNAVSANPVNVYRFHSPSFSNAHFYTTNQPEANHVAVNDSNWIYEGINFGAYANDANGCQSHNEVYRFWSSNFKTHFFTMNVAERNQLIAGDTNWWYEGVAYCANVSQIAGTSALYRFWSNNYKKHFFTASDAEKNFLIANDPNWQYEGVAYYVPKGKDCLHPDASIYDKTYTDRTNSGFLDSNGYDTTQKFYDALNFAGLLDDIDEPQVVVFAPNDYVYDNDLSDAQEIWMNQSPANMASVVGWHIIKSCAVYHNYLENGQTTILTTLNGPVTFTSNNGNWPHKLDNAQVAIYDWFTSNGTVHFIADFIKPPAM